MRRNALLHSGFRGIAGHCRRHRSYYLPGSVLLCAILGLILHSSKPRAWKTNEVPIAFWSWRSNTPSSNDMEAAIRDARMQTLFLHAGQIDWQDKNLKRIRPVDGSLPRGVPVHLVYNSTRAFLQDFERLNPYAVSAAVIAAFDQDLARARGDQAAVVGVQLDFDVPTRLLTNYAAMLRKIREQLPAGIQLSITGLPTWLGSTGLREPLSVCDFWVPQCYGASIPGDANQRIPITTAEFVERAVVMSRELGKPFYAGLAAYSYAIHYSQDGSLIGLRGDLDPQAVIANDRFVQTAEQPCFINGEGNPRVGEWLCSYRAIRDVMVDGTSIRTDQSLMLDRPTSAGLRECALKVREQGGRKLLGICVFRIPTDGDSTNLTLPEIVAAINDSDPIYSIEARATKTVANQESGLTRITLEIFNSGSATSQPGAAALNVLVPLRAGSICSIDTEQLTTADLVFLSGDDAVPCNSKRANAVRVSAAWWQPGSRLRVTIGVNDSELDELTAIYLSALDDGTTTSGSQTFAVAKKSK